MFFSRSKDTVFVVLAILIFALATMLLWNWLLPGLFGVPSINYLEAIGLMVLSRLLFGFGRIGSNQRPGMRDKWGMMTPEERKDFYQKMRHHHHHGEHYRRRDE
jgi:hypothetical protein